MFRINRKRPWTCRHAKSALPGLLLAPLIAAAEPNANSVSEVQACLEDASTALVCSSKELSNVTLQCGLAEGSFFHKVDELEDVLIENPYEGQFQCPEGSTILAVFVKSGSAQSGAAPGAGQAIFGPAACPVDCPAPGEPQEEPSDEEDSPDAGSPDEEVPR